MPDQVYDPLRWSKYLQELPHQFVPDEEDKVLLENLVKDIQPSEEVARWLRLVLMGYVKFNDSGDALVIIRLPI